MSLNAKRRRVHDKLAALPGVRPVRRPVSPGSDEQFDLYYVRTGRKSAHPLVVIPGGPGAASVQLYRGWRRRAAVKGLDVIMIEHRGIGMSRRTDAGTDLPPEAITIDQVVDDVAAVLDDAGVGKAVLYGTSYGSYIAAGVGVRHPGRVRAMILDSPLLSTRDIDAVRDAVRGVLLEGADPQTAELAPKIRRLVDDGVMSNASGHVATMVYAYGGAALLDRQLDLLLRGRTWLWSGLSRLGAMSSRKAPYRNEIDLVARIAFRELDYAGVPDGLPLDPAAAMREMTDITASFESEPYDLVAEMPKFDWPTVVVSGGRDLTTPPSVAERIASLIPGATLARLPTAGHSVLDTRERAAFAVMEAVRSDDIGRLSAPELDVLPGRPAIRLMVSAISVAAAVESVLPAAVPRVVQRVKAS
jgi:pimeloyl-ACP methyl ester carboxylesterase